MSEISEKKFVDERELKTKKNGNEEKKLGFVEAKEKFDEKYSNKEKIDRPFLPVNGKIKEEARIINSDGDKLEEYYRWQFLYALVWSGLYDQELIGCEIELPKGSGGSKDIRMDAVIFESHEWREHYKRMKKKDDLEAVEWLRNHMVGVIEFKTPSKNKSIKEVVGKQLRSYLKESDKRKCIGIIYDSERLFLFQKDGDYLLRYDDSKNDDGQKSSLSDLNLNIPDSYSYIPSMNQLLSNVNKVKQIDRANRTIYDLELITGVHSSRIDNAISSILQTLDKVSLVNQRGYEILIEILALKIFDEKRNESLLEKEDAEKKHTLDFYETKKEAEKIKLLFYIEEEEKNFSGLNDKHVQKFIDRMRTLYNDASKKYDVILKQVDTETINWRNENHVRAIGSIVENLQDYSFVRSQRHHQSDLYQLVFYRFANEFKKEKKGQFVTPLPLINFITRIVNPQKSETVVDPTAGIADFLSISYVNSNRTLDDSKLYGIDNDEQMVILAQLNMLLNGDGNAILRHQPNFGSLTHKFNTRGKLVSLDPDLHADGNWDNWVDRNQLMKFDVVLTNPPFGEDRKFKPTTKKEKEITKMYDIWDTAKVGDPPWIDPGLLFLENAYNILKENGRMGIILSNSLAAVNRWKEAREWIMNRLRVVALFDLPPNIFADTGVNTTVMIAYKPSEKRLEQLKQDDYEIFIRDIEKVGYEIKTKKRVKHFKPIYDLDEESFEIKIDDNGKPKLDEEFSEAIKAFEDWTKTQERELRNAFGR